MTDFLKRPLWTTLIGVSSRSITIAIALIAVMAIPTTQTMAGDASNRMKYCSDWADFAAVQMKFRQEGVPFTKAIELLKEAAPTKHDFDLAMQILQMAYEKDLARTYRGSDIAVIEFRESNFIACMDIEAD